MTKREAEEELRRMMFRDRPLEAGDEVTFAAAAELMLGDLEELGRKPTTLANYRSTLGFRLLPRFGESSVNRVRRSQVEAFAAQMIREGGPLDHASDGAPRLSDDFDLRRLRTRR